MAAAELVERPGQGCPDMPHVPPTHLTRVCQQNRQAFPSPLWIDPKQLNANSSSISIYGDPSTSEDIDGLRESIRQQGILVPLVLTPAHQHGGWEILSGHRR